MESTEDIYEIATVREDHVDTYTMGGSDPDTLGWTKGSLDGYEIVDDTFRIYVRLPWGERHRYTTSLSSDNSVADRLQQVCDAYDCRLSEFETLIGEDAWVKIRYVDYEDGEISTGSRLNWDAVTDGPWHTRKRFASVVLKWIGFFLIVFGLPVIAVL